ncbi:MAG: hydroxyacid dehydrogenase [Acidimicrobiia bacterium]|nr:hydroxyacid dehydrogenase [Acidimicrobiia bacterium]
MADVVVSEFMNEAALAPLHDDYAVLFDPKLVDDRPRLLAEMGSAIGIIVRNRTQVDAELLAAAPHLKVVGRLGVGLDNIDLAACSDRGVAVHPATGANAQAVAEYVVAAILVLFRGAYQSSSRVVGGEWPRADLQGRESAGKRLGLVGLGAIAQMVAARATALGLEVNAYDPYLPADDPAWESVNRMVDFDALLGVADAISVHVPLTDDTRHLVDAAALDKLPSGAIVINTARGGIVDDAALAAAIRSGQIAGAALDVFEDEPVTAQTGQLFNGLDNVVLTPHIAGLTAESNARVSDMTVYNVLHTLKEQ